jgi:hypothetical protein
MLLTKKSLRALDVNNYQVDTVEGHYYLLDGRRSLKRFAKRHGLVRASLYKTLLVKRQLVIQDESITVI